MSSVSLWFADNATIVDEQAPIGFLLYLLRIFLKSRSLTFHSFSQICFTPQTAMGCLWKAYTLSVTLIAFLFQLFVDIAQRDHLLNSCKALPYVQPPPPLQRKNGVREPNPNPLFVFPLSGGGCSYTQASKAPC